MARPHGFGNIFREKKQSAENAAPKIYNFVTFPGRIISRKWRIFCGEAEVTTLKSQKWKTYAAWIALTEAVGGLSGWLTRQGTQYFNQAVTKPPFSPPGIVFPVAWAILYLLMGIGAARVYLAPVSRARSRSLFLYLLQLAFNFCWSVIFFTVRAYGFAFVWLVALWFLILAMILEFRRVDALAAGLQVPYLLWVLFAAYLNAGVWVLNR